MPRPLKVLIAEDNPADAELMLRELRRGGYEPDWQRVDTEAAYVAALQGGIEVVLADYAMPQFNGLRALKILKEQGWEIPFILVSGVIGEEAAVAAMRNGATDYLLKDRLLRLSPAVDMALEQTRLRQERRRAKTALEDSKRRYLELLKNVQAS